MCVAQQNFCEIELRNGRQTFTPQIEQSQPLSGAGCGNIELKRNLPLENSRNSSSSTSVCKFCMNRENSS